MVTFLCGTQCHTSSLRSATVTDQIKLLCGLEKDDKKQRKEKIVVAVSDYDEWCNVNYVKPNFK